MKLVTLPHNEAGAPLHDSEGLKVVNLGKVIRDCKLRIATAYQKGGDSHALVAVACSSIVLQAYVEAGSLRQAALSHIADTARNLGLHRRLGAKVVFAALHTGPHLYDLLADVWECQQRTSRPSRQRRAA